MADLDLKGPSRPYDIEGRINMWGAGVLKATSMHFNSFRGQMTP